VVQGGRLAECISGEGGDDEIVGEGAGCVAEFDAAEDGQEFKERAGPAVEEED
jgi:hypothetical protein